MGVVDIHSSVRLRACLNMSARAVGAYKFALCRHVRLSNAGVQFSY
jgi:hypothetical protein